MMGWCWVCHKWVWPWQCVPTPTGVFPNHKTCESEALKRRIETADGWPEGISDGLSLPCCVCRLPVAFDYGVDDTFWQVVVPKEYKQSVVCLSCLATLASEKGRQIGEHLRFVQFVGIGETVVLLPESIYQYAT